jgi:prephenate dehydrogenase
MTTAAAPRIDKLVILGVGLIGGSFALAQKAARATGSVVGVGRGRINLEEAANLGIVDRFVLLTDDWTAEISNADVVLIATPLAQYPSLFRAIAPHLGPHTIVTDAGSTKQDVIAAARATLGAALPRFVPAHPIAGTEHSGAAAAYPALFADRNVVLTPTPETDPLALATVAAAWQTCGARIRTLDAALHDRIFAAVSHLPHLLAFALVDELAARPDAEVLFRFAASGFRDFTRIAASSPEMWRDISLANRDALLAELAAFRAQLDRMATQLEAGDGSGLEAMFAKARNARRSWDSGRGSPTGRVPDDGAREP